MAMYGILVGDKGVSMQRSGHCGWCDNPGDMWANGLDRTLIHAIPSLVLAVHPHDNAMMAASVVGSE